MTQPHLDYIAPEIQSIQNSKSKITQLSDIFSLGLTICSLYTNGNSLIDAQHNPQIYAKRVETVSKIDIIYMRLE